MKAGDLVKLNPKSRWLSKNSYNMTGLIIRVLSGEYTSDGNTGCEVMWSNDGNYGPDSGWHSSDWHTSKCLKKIN